MTRSYRKSRTTTRWWRTRWRSSPSFLYPLDGVIVYINLLTGAVVLLRVRLERGGEPGGRDRSARALETCHLGDLASDVGNERVVLCLVGLCSFIIIASV